MRTVVLRGANQKRAELTVHTDVRSPKVASLRANPFAELHVWDPSTQLQVRLEAKATMLFGDAVASIWAGLSEATRQAYGSLPAPGEAIAEPLAYSRQPDFARFAVVTLELVAIDVLHLGVDHRRARFERRSSWAGCWLSP